MVRRQVSAKKQKRSRFAFVGDTVSELKKVVWPTRQETVRLTAIVLVVAVIIGLILGLTDFGFGELMKVIL
ncbi:preprotein translocase subunit SecE [Chloroflexota bacterium]